MLLAPWPLVTVCLSWPGLAMLDTTFEMDDRSHYGMGNRNGSPDRYFTCKFCQRLFR